MSWLLALLAKPFVLFAYLRLNATAVLAVKRRLPDGRLKRLLLREV